MQSNIILYSTGCPKCNVLIKKLNAKNIQFTPISDVAIMQDIGIDTVPQLSVNGKLLNYRDAVEFINGIEVE